MSPDARDRVERWLEGCRRARCDGYLQSELGGEGDRGEEVNGEEVEEKKGFLASWSTSGIQRSIESIASRRTENQLGKSKEGMKIVLERLRSGGLVGVLEGMRKDREMAFGGESVWKHS